MLEHVILKLKAAGFDQIVINIHHLGEQIIDFLKANQNFGVTIYISDERDYLLDTGGGIKKAEPFLQGNEPFLVHNVDILSNVDLLQLYRLHQSSPKALATLLVSRRKTSRYLLFNKENQLLSLFRPGAISRVCLQRHPCHLAGNLPLDGGMDRQVPHHQLLPFHLCQDEDIGLSNRQT